MLLPDNDTAGRNYAAKVVAQLIRLNPLPTIRQVRLPGLPEGGDLHDFVAAMEGRPLSEIVAQIESVCDRTALVRGASIRAQTVATDGSSVVEPAGEPPVATTTPSKSTQEDPMHTIAPLSPPAKTADTSPIVTRLDDCHSSPIRWLWPGRVPAGKLTLLVGDPGLGKSFVTLDIAARVSRGQSLPHLADEHHSTETISPGSVVLLSAEDNASGHHSPATGGRGAPTSNESSYLVNGAAGRTRKV